MIWHQITACNVILDVCSTWNFESLNVKSINLFSTKQIIICNLVKIPSPPETGIPFTEFSMNVLPNKT